MNQDRHDFDRRRFLALGGGVALGGAIATACKSGMSAPKESSPSAGGKWERVRAMFDLDPEYAHFGGFLLAAHPRPVREAIESYRRRLDRNPVMTLHELSGERSVSVRAAAAAFVGGQPEELALTDSTTMGLGLVYGGLRLTAGQEIVTTEYDHYATHQALRFRATRDGLSLRKVGLFAHSAQASGEEIVGRLMAAVTDRTRVVAVTWVHSMSGVRLPISAIAAALADRNRSRAEADRALLCVDGVHGTGVVPFSVGDFGADFFIAGTHKWVFGPRGTGLVWGRPSAWASVAPTIPPFERPTSRAWMQGTFADDVPPGMLHTPGGFHSFEHRWALPAAFDFQDSIGRTEIARRIFELNLQLKEGLAKMPKVELWTPMSEELSAGITCFSVEGVEPHAVVARFVEKKIIATTTPYLNTYARLAPGLLNTESEVDRALAVVRDMA